MDFIEWYMKLLSFVIGIMVLSVETCELMCQMLSEKGEGNFPLTQTPCGNSVEIIMQNDNYLRLPKIGRSEVSIGLFVIGMLVIFFSSIKLWPWFLLVLGASEIQLLFRERRFQSKHGLALLWFVVLPVIIHLDNLHPRQHIIEYGMVALAAFSMTILFINSKLSMFHSRRHRSHGSHGHHHSSSHRSSSNSSS
jgi:hypothetical protein